MELAVCRKGERKQWIGHDELLNHFAAYKNTHR
jgi:hypothetical protein